MRPPRASATLLAVVLATFGAVDLDPAVAQEPESPPFDRAAGAVEMPRPATRGRQPQQADETGDNLLLRHGRFTALPEPRGATSTVHAGMNDRGQSVGVYLDADGVPHGFVYTPTRRRQGAFRTIDIPGTEATVPRDINDRGQIVGTYGTGGTVPGPDGQPVPEQHAFVWDRGTVTVVDPPDTVYAPNAYSINDRGEIAGSRHFGDGTQLGYLRQPDGDYITLDPPVGAASKALGVNDRGQVVGAYLDDDAEPGSNGLFAPGTVHGYHWDRGRYDRLDVPRARATAAFGINDRGRIVGEVKDAGGRIRGFLRSPGPTHRWWTYRFVDGPGNPGESMAIDVNDRGDILIPAPGSIEHLVDLVA